MLFYHIDHSGRLSPGIWISPNTTCLSYENWTPEIYTSFCDTFTDGVGNFGARALLPTSNPEIVQQHVREFILEVVRLRSFPKLPSRLTSFFGMRDALSNLPRWCELLEVDASKVSVYECESDKVYTVDASCLDLPNPADTVPNPVGPPPSHSDTAPAALSFPAAYIHAARQYWLSCRPLERHRPANPASSDIAQAQYNPKPYLEELLAPGLVHVIRQVWP